MTNAELDSILREAESQERAERTEAALQTAYGAVGIVVVVLICTGLL